MAELGSWGIIKSVTPCIHNKSAQGRQNLATDLYHRLLALVHWFAFSKASGAVTYSAGDSQSCHADLASMCGVTAHPVPMENTARW